MEKRIEQNKLIRKAFLMMYPASLILAFMGQIEELLDSLLAGNLLGEEAISAVAIGWPGIAVLLAISVIFYVGVALLLSIYIGRGEKEKSNRLYSIGMVGVPACMTIVGIIVFLFPEPLVKLFSGGASGHVIELANNYAKLYGIVVPLFIIEGVISEVLMIYGYSKEVAIINVIGIPINVITSIVSVKWLGTINPDYAIIGLVLGYFVSTLYEDVALIIMKIKKKINLKIVKFKSKPKDYAEIAQYGLPIGINCLIDSLIYSVINLILVQNIGQEALAYFIIVDGILILARATMEAGINAGAPLFGLLFGAKDENGIKTSVKECIGMSFIITMLFEVILYNLLPIVIPFFGELSSADGYAIVHRGITIGLILFPAYLVIKCFGCYYQATGHFKQTLAITIIPDSVIYPLTLFLIIGAFNNKYDALWIAYSGCYLIYLVLIYIAHVIRTHKLKWQLGDMLLLGDNFNEKVVFDFSTSMENDEKGATVSEQVIEFLEEQKYSRRIANMCGLCIEELNADFMKHTKKTGKNNGVMDIKLISDNGKLHMIIRNIAKPYNPLDFEYNTEDFSKLGIVMIQKFAKKIEYDYVYKMNVITIDFNAQ